MGTITYDTLLRKNVLHNHEEKADVDSPSFTGEIILPQQTTETRDLLTATAGMLIWNTTTSTMQVYNGSAWINMGVFN